MTQASVAYGQATPFDGNTDFDVVRFHCRQLLAELDTMKLVSVIAVHGGGGAIARAGTVDVLPLVNQLDGQGNATPHGVVYGIPWWRLQGGSGAVVIDPVIGDIGYVAVSDRDISNVVRAGQQSNPGSYRKYSVADGIYVGGCLNGPPTQYVAITTTGVTIADLSGNVIRLMAGGIFVTGNLVVTGNITATGTITPGV